MTARDLRYGRRGGGWIDGDPVVPVRCDVCGRMVTTGGDRHVDCRPDPDQLTLFPDQLTLFPDP